MVNELKPELLSTNSLNPFIRWMSASRIPMFSSHITQTMWIKGNTHQGIYSGMEKEFANYTHKVKVPVDARILKTIYRYRRTVNMPFIKESPEWIVIYEHPKVDPDTGREYMELDYLHCEAYHSKSKSFGFKYEQVNPIEEYMAEGTEVLISPSIDKETGNWRYGIEANVCYITEPGGIEDGYIVSESFSKKVTTLCLEDIDLNFGKHKFPINLYGDDSKYKPFPNIGETIGEDGVLMVLREYNRNSAPVTMSKKALREPDFMYDDVVYATPGAKIVDIRVQHDYRVDGVLRGRNSNMPTGTTEQLEAYLEAEHTYWKQIRDYYEGLQRSKTNVKLSPRLDNLIYNSYIHTVGAFGNTDGFKPDFNKAIRNWRGSPIDEWQVVFTIAYDQPLETGGKFTGRQGNKGVVVGTRPDEDMPVTESGVRADIIGDPIAIGKRMIVGTMFEQYVNAATTNVVRTISGMIDNKRPLDEIRSYLTEYYAIVSPTQHKAVCELDDKHFKKHVDIGVAEWKAGHPTGLNIAMSIGEQIDAVAVGRDLMNSIYRPELLPVTYRGMSGELVTTVDPVLIGSLYILPLEKTGKTWAGVSISKLSHFGIPAKITKNTKFLMAGRNQSVRFGESEYRLFVSTVGPKALSDVIDRTMNAGTREDIIRNILTSKTPSGLESTVNRRKFPVGDGRMTKMVRHYNESAGRKFKRDTGV